MANCDVKPRFIKGISGNPLGRPKGTPNRTSIARYVLAMTATPPAELLAAIKAQYPAIDEPYTIELVGTIRLAQKMIEEGDVRAYLALMDAAYGKPRQEIEQATADKDPGQMTTAELEAEVRRVLNVTVVDTGVPIANREADVEP